MKLLRRNFLGALASALAAIWSRKARAGFGIFQINGSTIVQATWYVDRDSGRAATHSSALPAGGLTETLAAAAANDVIALYPNATAVSYAARNISIAGLTFKSAYVRNPITNHPMNVPGRSTRCPPDSVASCLALGMAQCDQWQILANNVMLDNLYFQLSPWPAPSNGSSFPAGGAFGAGVIVVGNGSFPTVSGTVISACRIRHGRSPGWDGTSPTITGGVYTSHDSYDLVTEYPEFNAYGPGFGISLSNWMYNNVADGISANNGMCGIIITENTITDVESAYSIVTSGTNAVGPFTVTKNIMARYYFHPGQIQLNLPPASFTYSWNLLGPTLASVGFNTVLQNGTVTSGNTLITGIADTSQIQIGMCAVDWTNDSGAATFGQGPYGGSPGASSLLKNTNSNVDNNLLFPSVVSKTVNSVTLSAAASGGSGTTIAIRFVGDRNIQHSSGMLMGVQSAVNTTVDWLNFAIEGNINFNSAHGGMQNVAGFLYQNLQTTNTSIWYEHVKIRGNIHLGGNVFSAEFSPSRNTLFYGNTFVSQIPANPPNYSAAALGGFSIGAQTGSPPTGFQYISANISDADNNTPTGSTASGIILANSNPTTKLGPGPPPGSLIPYFYNGSTGIFVGPAGFNPQSPSDVLAMYKPATGSGFEGNTLATMHGAIGNTYADFINCTINSNLEATIINFSTSPLTGQTPGATGLLSDISVISGGPGGTISIAGTGSPTYALYNDFAGTSTYQAFTSGSTSNVPEGKYIQVKINAPPGSGQTNTATVTFTGTNGTFNYTFVVQT